jgi:hypothetical protein
VRGRDEKGEGKGAYHREQCVYWAILSTKDLGVCTVYLMGNEFFYFVFEQ